MRASLLPFLACIPAIIIAQDTRDGTTTSTKLTTNGSDYYQATVLLPGTYAVAVEFAGFK